MVVLAEDVDMKDILADIDLVCYLDDLVFTILVEDDDIVDIRAVEEELVFLKGCADKAIFTVDIQLLVGLYDSLDIDVGEVANFSTAWVFGSVLLFERVKPRNGIVGEVLEILDSGFDLFLKILHQFICFLSVKASDTDHSNLKESFYILTAYFAHEFVFPRIKGFVHKSDKLLLVRGVLVALFLIYTVLNEDFLQRCEEVLLL